MVDSENYLFGRKYRFPISGSIYPLGVNVPRLNWVAPLPVVARFHLVTKSPDCALALPGSADKSTMSAIVRKFFIMCYFNFDAAKFGLMLRCLLAQYIDYTPRFTKRLFQLTRHMKNVWKTCLNGPTDVLKQPKIRLPDT